MDLNLAGRHALITGSSRGIGAAVAWVLAEEGCPLHLVARDGEAPARQAERLRGAHAVPVNTHAVDLRDPGVVARLADAAGGAGTGDLPGGALDLLDDDAWRDGFALKVFGCISLTRHLYARMKERGGVIINNIGASGEGGDPDYIAGCTANAALMAFTRAPGGTSLNDNIRVLGVKPRSGRHRTDRRADQDSRRGPARRRRPVPRTLCRHANGRAGQHPSDRRRHRFLASERPGYTSGPVLTIDGGLIARAGFAAPTGTRLAAVK